MEKEKVLISACLLGCACRYDGESREYDLKDWKDKYILVPFCPEIYGGLPTPRVPCEIVKDRVINKNGEDVTAQYKKGAEEAARLCDVLKIKKAILKSRSPSCGKGEIYDGSFTGETVPGDGITAGLLAKNGIEIITEK